MRWTRPLQQAFAGAGARSSGTLSLFLGVGPPFLRDIQCRVYTYK